MTDSPTPADVQALLVSLGALVRATGPEEFTIPGILGQVQEALQDRQRTQRRMEKLEGTIAGLVSQWDDQDAEIKRLRRSLTQVHNIDTEILDAEVIEIEDVQEGTE